MQNTMDIFFTKKHTYVVNDTLFNVREKFELITNKRWYDFSENITGNISDDHSFRLTHKWSFTYIKWLEKSPAYLSGTLSSDQNKTIIQSTVRPNSAFIIAFYLFTILFLCELFGLNTFLEGPKLFRLLFIPFFNLILFGLMTMFTTGLRNRFERIFNLRPKQYLPKT